MKVLKTIGIAALALLGLVLILGLIAPREMTSERSALIKAPPQQVFNTVNDLGSWASWSPWIEMDPGTQVTLGDTTAGPGAYYLWKGKKSGSGKMSIVSSEAPKGLETEIFFEGMGIANSGWTFAAEEGGTRVTWNFRSKMGYPMNALLLLGMDPVGKDFERGLQLLKEKVEKEASEPKRYKGYVIEIVDWPQQHYAAVRRQIEIAEFAAFYGAQLSKIMAALDKKGQKPTGSPSGLYFVWDEAAGKTDMAVAVPVETPQDLGKEFAAITLPAGKALKVDYYGNSEGSVAAHYALDEYVGATGTKVGFPVIEEYATDPGTEPDTSKWLTRIYYPIIK